MGTSNMVKCDMISLQGQQLLLRHIFASYRKVPGNESDFAPLLEALRRSDDDAVCHALQKYTDACTPVILDYVLEKGGMR